MMVGFFALFSCVSALLAPGAASRLAPTSTVQKKRASMKIRGGKSTAVMMTPGGLWAGYNSALASRPIVTKALTSFTGFTIADLLAQKFAEKQPTIDWARTARMAGFGILWHGPSGHYIYNFLDKLVPGNSFKAVMSKVFLDQLVHNPVFALVFFTYLNIVEGKSFQALKDTIKRDFFTTVTGSYVYWIPAHIINFRFIPGSHRVLYINVMQILWNMFLSIIGNKKV